MKKILKLSTLALTGLLATTGCSFGKDEEPSYIGEYVFEYMRLDTEGESLVVYTCPASENNFSIDNSLDDTIDIDIDPLAICSSATKQTIEIKEDRLIATADGKSEIQYYKLNEKGEMLVAMDENGEPAKSLQEAKAYFVYNIKFENDRIYNVLSTDEDGISTVLVYKKK